MKNLFLLTVFLGSVFVAVPAATAQVDANPATMGISDLRDTLQRILEQGDFVMARPYLEEMDKRFVEEPPEERPQLAPVIYYLALSYLQEYSGSPSDELLGRAIEYFERYETEYPDGELLADAVMFKGDAYRGLGDFKQAAAAHERLLVQPIVADLPEPKRLDALDKTVASYYILRDWEKGIPWFRELLRVSVDPEKRARAAAALIEAYIGQGEFDEVRSLLPYIVVESPARYNLQLNVALLEAGDQVSDLGRFSEASLYYYMVLTLEDILAYQTERVEDLRSQLSLLEITSGESDRATELRAEVYNAEQNIAALKEIPSYTAELQVRMARNYVLTERNWEAFWAYQRLMVDNPEHPAIEDFTYAAFSQAVSLGLADLVEEIGEQYQGNTQFDAYGRDIAVRMAEFYLQDGQTERFFEHSRQFITRNPEDEYNPQFIYLMGSTYIAGERYDELIEDFSNILSSYPNAAMLDGCNYWIGLAQLFNRSYESAQKHFEVVIDDYPQSPYVDDSFYRAAVSDFGLEDYEGALERFLTFTSEYPNSPLRGEAEFFLGDLYSLLDQPDQALHHYQLVDKHSDNLSFIRNAAFLSADIYESQGRYDEMQAVTEGFIERHGDKAEHSEALFILGRAHDLQGRPGEMDAAFWSAVEQFGDQRTADGVDEILAFYPDHYAKVRAAVETNFEFFNRLKNDDEFRRMMATDRRAFFQFYFENPELDFEFRELMARDLDFVRALPDQPELIDPFLEIHQQRLAALPELTPVERMQQLLVNTDQSSQPTLYFRLMMALDNAGVEDVVGDMVFTPVEFEQGSPATIVWMGGEAAEFDQNSARIAYETVIREFPLSPAVQDALIALGNLEAANDSYELAFDFYREAQAQFPTSKRAVQAILRQGDMLMEMSRYDAALERYETVMRNREWRGEPQAEALFKIGMINFRQSDWKRAHAFFERTVAGHSAYREWAAKAYLYNGRALQNLGEFERARENDAEFLESSDFESMPEFAEIQQRFNQMQ